MMAASGRSGFVLPEPPERVGQYLADVSDAVRSAKRPWLPGPALVISRTAANRPTPPMPRHDHADALTAKALPYRERALQITSRVR